MIKMAQTIIKGKIRARIIELRFAISGKLANISKKKGDYLKKGELVAVLDKKILQTELDRQLADYEKVRAEFEIYNLKEGEPQNDIDKYFKAIKQAQLNVSVKEVELSKAKLDQTDLFSPVDGIILDDSDLVPGIYITPSSNPIKVLDKSSYYFEAEILQENVLNFLETKQCNVNIFGLGKAISGSSKPIISSIDGKFYLQIPLQDSPELFLGLEGQITT